MRLIQKNDFKPNWMHPYYFIRMGLYNKLKEQSSLISGRVLDFGCGSKPYRSLFNVSEYVGLDYENKGHSHEEEQIDYYYNGESFPFENQSFDALIATEVFEHIFNLDIILLEINRILKPGGHILITCPFVWNEHEVPYDYARYTHYSLRSMLEKADFEIIKMDKSGNFITVIFQLWNLYFFRKLYGKLSQYIFTNWCYKLLVVLPINVAGNFINLLFPKDNSLYLNNIVIAKKRAL